MKRIAIVLSISVFGLLFAPDAGARTNRELTYRYSQIWGTVVRFLRVDNGFKIIEKEKDDGYLLFEYRDGERKYQSSFQLVEVVIEGRHYVRIGLHIESMPSYVEVLLQDKLKRKLRSEYGEPPPPKSVEKPKPVQEETDEDDEDDNNSESEGDSIDKKDYAASEESKEE